MREREFILAGNYQSLDNLYRRLAASEKALEAAHQNIRIRNNDQVETMGTVRNLEARVAAADAKEVRHLAAIEALANEFMTFDSASYHYDAMPKLANLVNEVLELPEAQAK